MVKGRGSNPGAGNLDKHIKRKEHKERSQPHARQHLGQLEKKKDHVLRARKRKAKVQKLNELKRAAAQRNPDEFNIGMTKAVLDIASGRMKARKARQGRGERAKELKKTVNNNIRNVQYLEFKAQSDMNRAKDLLDEDATAAVTAGAPSNKHVIFVETEDELKHFNAGKYFDATPEMLKQHPATRGKISVLRNTVLPEEMLLAGQHVQSTAQRRKERKKLQEKLRKSGLTDEASRAALVERYKLKKQNKQFRFEDILAAENLRKESQCNSSDLVEEDDAPVDEATRVMEQRAEQERQTKLMTARRVKEIAQRVERAKSLQALAKTVRRQNTAIQRQMQQKRESRFKPTMPRRSR